MSASRQRIRARIRADAHARMAVSAKEGDVGGVRARLRDCGVRGCPWCGRYLAMAIENSMTVPA